MKSCWLITALLIAITGCRQQPQGLEVTPSSPTSNPTTDASISVAPQSENQPSPSLSPSSRPTPLPQSTTEAILIATDTNAQINLRAAPSVTSKRLGYALADERVQVIKQAASTDSDRYTWYQVRFPRSGAIAWIREDFVRLKTSHIPSASPTPP
jgi:hypothetical protein